MDRDKIEVGDIVSVTFPESDGYYPKLEVLSVPQAIGDSWRLKNPDTGLIHYIMTFETMTLMKKKEVRENVDSN